MIIKVQMPNETVAREERRAPGTMDLDSLRWCFCARIDFVESNATITLPEASLLGFIEQLSLAQAELRRCSPGGTKEAIIRDYEGSFELTIRKDGHGGLTLKEASGAQSLATTENEFVSAVRSVVNEACAVVESTFPALLRNPHYQSMIQEIQARIEAQL